MIKRESGHSNSDGIPKTKNGKYFGSFNSLIADFSKTKIK